jgi:hypothetical protein
MHAISLQQLFCNVGPHYNTDEMSHNSKVTFIICTQAVNATADSDGGPCFQASRCCRTIYNFTRRTSCANVTPPPSQNRAALRALGFNMSHVMNSQFSAGAPSLQVAEGLADAANQGPCMAVAAAQVVEYISKQDVECMSSSDGHGTVHG